MSECCEYCDDGSGSSIFPFYGLAPHRHSVVVVDGEVVGDNRGYPENFEEDSDPDWKGCGTYLYCPKCGAGQ